MTQPPLTSTSTPETGAPTTPPSPAVRIITVGPSGLGVSLLIEMTARCATPPLGISADIEALDLATAQQAAPRADLLLASPELVDALASVAPIVRPIRDPLDVADVTRQISLALGQRDAIA